ncbi:unnamed protein product, partial [Discosporangium mesarthrocarpum]
MRLADITYKGVGIAVACARGDLPLVCMLVTEGEEQGVDMLSADEEGNNPLHYAALSENPSLIDYLLRKARSRGTIRGWIGNGGGAINGRARGPSLLPPPGCPGGHAWFVEMRNNEDETALLRSAVKGDMGVMKALLDAGAALDAADSSGNTVFHNAARNGRVWALAYCIAAAAGDSLKGSDGSGNGNGNGTQGSARLRPLARRGGGGEGISAEGHAVRWPQLWILCCALARACGGGWGVGGGRVGGAMVLLNGQNFTLPLRSSRRGLLWKKDCDGHTALEWACYAGHLRIVRMLLDQGLNPTARDRGGKTCLHWAATQGKAEICRMLVMLGGDPRAPDTDGQDAFHLSENH